MSCLKNWLYNILTLLNVCNIGIEFDFPWYVYLCHLSLSRNPECLHEMVAQ